MRLINVAGIYILKIGARPIFFWKNLIAIIIKIAKNNIAVIFLQQTPKPKQIPAAIYFSFLYNRVLRLYPPLWISFLIISVANMVIFNIDLFSFGYLVYAIKYCIFANGAGFGSSGIANGVLWTIMADIIFYIIARK